MASAVSDKLLEAFALVLDVAIENARTIIPGKISEKTREAARERDASLDPGPGQRQGGDQLGDGEVAGAPVIYPGGGGFGMVWPLDVGDEALGLCSDRGAQQWRRNREPGESALLDQRHHHISDAMLLPFSITAPASAPEDWGDDFYLVGPQGVAIKIAGLDGQVDITTENATLTLTQAGDVSVTTAGTITLDGATVNAGSPGAEAVAKSSPLDAAITAGLAAGSAAGTGAPGTTGKLAMDAFKIAYDAAKGPVATTVLKGL